MTALHADAAAGTGRHDGIEVQDKVGTSTDIPDGAASSRTRRMALIGSAVGSAVEWYDYFLYGTMASIVFGRLFFPSSDPATETLLSLASFALAFLVRPIGGIIFSHIGDRIGRKKTLVMTLSLMGASTAAMGLLPDHAAIVGGPAPLIATGLLAQFHSYVPVGVFIIVCGLVSLWAISQAADRTGAALD